MKCSGNSVTWVLKKLNTGKEKKIKAWNFYLYEVVTTVPQTGPSSFQALLIQQLSVCVTFYSHKYYWFNNHHSVSLSTATSSIDSTSASSSNFNFSRIFLAGGYEAGAPAPSCRTPPPPPPPQAPKRWKFWIFFSGNSGNHILTRTSRFMSWLVDFRKKMFPLSLCSDLRISANLWTSGSTVQQSSVCVTFYIHWQNPRCWLRSFTLATSPLWLITNPGSIKVISLRGKC